MFVFDSDLMARPGREWPLMKCGVQSKKQVHYIV